MSHQIVQVDAFTDRPFTGNPAAVCILEDLPHDWWLQDVAREMNLSETAFLVGHEDGYDLRWFTPQTEVDLCGHATLASAHVLWEDGHLASDSIAKFHTRSGVLTATRKDDGWIEMDFPATPATTTVQVDRIAQALGGTPDWIGRNDADLLAVFSDEKAIRTLRPNMSLISRIDARGIIATAPAASPSYDFVSRFFAPKVGVPEDPVTGSAHCTLGPYWAEKFGTPELIGYQVSSRGGTVRVRVDGERVTLAGRAITVLRGQLLV